MLWLSQLKNEAIIDYFSTTKTYEKLSNQTGFKFEDLINTRLDSTNIVNKAKVGELFTNPSKILIIPGTNRTFAGFKIFHNNRLRSLVQAGPHGPKQREAEYRYPCRIDSEGGNFTFFWTQGNQNFTCKKFTKKKGDKIGKLASKNGILLTQTLGSLIEIKPTNKSTLVQTRSDDNDISVSALIGDVSLSIYETSADRLNPVSQQSIREGERLTYTSQGGIRISEIDRRAILRTPEMKAFSSTSYWTSPNLPPTVEKAIRDNINIYKVAVASSTSTTATRPEPTSENDRRIATLLGEDCSCPGQRSGFILQGKWSDSPDLLAKYPRAKLVCDGEVDLSPLGINRKRKGQVPDFEC
ncbi:hypothetical protein HRE53_30040 (plasmid) [Acaryochloris sp. 'Moss Beach']|uniref:hypothetical protein n=1 Tax=Acaryochloris sp. 'Moss Beach' TaxID=2740837 RepID=UPI001F2C93C2|nr:hypothetical protein [Acaryochloris sp. 'Moss Beach']UJB72975.1 hypothetical protein HRE53_30040 [Acaryochloris sp. 'Moss Beach']